MGRPDPLLRLEEMLRWGSPAAHVNLAARIAAHAAAGQVLVSQRVAESGPPVGVRFVELGELELKGFARPVGLLELRRI